MKLMLRWYHRRRMLILLCSIALFSIKAKCGEFAIINQEFTYSVNANSFSCHVSPPYPNNVPTNWLSPEDYWNGSFYAYYQVISVPTNEPFGFQMGVFQYCPSRAQWDGHNYYETCSFDVPKLQGAGDIVQFNYGAPANWWQHWNGSVDFSRVYDFESVGPIIWSLVPGAEGNLSPTSGGGVDAAWEIRYNWFPCTIRVIIVAVSNGCTFSGWNNYLNGTPQPPPTPSYTVNYSSEKTNQNIPSTDEYSYSSGMSPAYSGSGSQLSLTPGTDVYFRTKANGSIPASAIQHLTVPARPSTPSYTIDYSSEKTSENVSSDVEYSTSSSFTSPSNGSGSQVPLTPGQNLYFRKKVTGSSFTSSAFQLTVASRSSGPSVSINYPNEKTNEVLATTVEYSTSASMAGATCCSNAQVSLTPGTDLYFRYKSTGNTFASSNTLLDVPARPVSPSIAIDFPNEQSSAIPATIDWSLNSNLSSATQGTGNAIPLTPGNDLYLRSKATSNTFASTIQHLVVPGRPAAPSIKIDYINEITSAVATTIEWSQSASMISPVIGQGTGISVTPGTDLYFRIKATASSFKSEIQSLDVPLRPSTPSYSLNYTNETTDEPVSTQDDYSLLSDMSIPIAGTDSSIEVTPGTDLYFRTRATVSSFCSPIQKLVVANRTSGPEFSIDYVQETTAEVVDSNVEFGLMPDLSDASYGTGAVVTVIPQSSMYFRTGAGSSLFKSEISELVIPARNFLGYEGSDTISYESFVMYVVLADTTLEFSLDYLQITNGIAMNLREGNIFDIYSANQGNVIINLPANTVSQNSFGSNEVVVYFDKLVGVSDHNVSEGFIVYPNPSDGDIVTILSENNVPYTIEIISGDGRIIRDIQTFQGKYQEVTIKDLKQGIYFIKITCNKTLSIHKLILN
jgi:hypothetical protein